MRVAGSLQRRRAARQQRPRGRPRSGPPGPISIPSFATRSGRLQDEVRLQAGFLRTAHHGTQEDGFEFTAVIGEMAMRLAEDRNDLRHLETELAILVGERGAVALRLVLLPFGGVRPDLDALPGKRRAVAGAAHGTAHPETALPDPLHDRRALAVVVRAARHRFRGCETCRAGGQPQPGNSRRREHGAAGDEEVAAVKHDDGHVNSSWRTCDWLAEGTTTSA